MLKREKLKKDSNEEEVYSHAKKSGAFLEPELVNLNQQNECGYT